MKKIVLLILLIALIVFTWAEREQGKVFLFTKIAEQNNEFIFEYFLENGTKFKGNTTYLFDIFDSNTKMQIYFYLLLDAANVIHWVNLPENDLNSTEQLYRRVFPVNRADTIEFQNDYERFSFQIDSGILSKYRYITEWDFQNICFKKIHDDPNIFHYQIRSLNNNRIYEGDTYHKDEDDIHSERINLNDPGKIYYVIRVDFRNEEIQLNDTFCREISEIISVYDTDKPSHIDLCVLKSCIG